MRRTRILLAIDASDASAAAVRLAGGIASALKADVAVLHAHEPGFSDTGHDAPESRAAAALAAAGIPARIEVRSGEPAEEIVAASRRVKPDLLVMGSRGRSRLGKAILGSVSQEVMARVTCPVLLVRADGDTVAGPYSIVVAVEGQVGLDPLLAVTKKLARALSAKVFLVHVSYPRGEELERTIYHAHESHGEQALASAAAALVRAGLQVESKVLNTRAGLARSLAEFSESIGADLIVMGAHPAATEFGPAIIGPAVSVSHLSRRPLVVAREDAKRR
ncbi:MAG TPA: universal stress protein [Candidatus Dormibacteraeota bacterium]|nr:universal stress protein [Candidatus Dormibacteraeota bacterium]